MIEALIGENARERLTAVKRGLQSILELLASARGAEEFRLAAPTVAAGSGAGAGDAGGAGQGVARQGAGVAQRIGALSPSAPQAFSVRSVRRDVA